MSVSAPPLAFNSISEISSELKHAKNASVSHLAGWIHLLLENPKDTIPEKEYKQKFDIKVPHDGLQYLDDLAYSIADEINSKSHIVKEIYIVRRVMPDGYQFIGFYNY